MYKDTTIAGSNCIYINIHALTRIVNKDGVTSLAVLDNLTKGIHQVLVRGRDMFAVIHQQHNVFLLESMYVLDVSLHVLDVIVATSQDALRMTNVVDATVSLQRNAKQTKKPTRKRE
jgi:pyoverdine/dityrosine biosynthesis protein Dit1